MVEMENCCLLGLIDRFRKRDMTAFPIIFNEFEKLINFYSYKLSDEDAFQELTTFLLELLYNLDFRVFKKDSSDSLKRYIAVCIRNKYIAISKGIEKHKTADFPVFENAAADYSDFLQSQILKDAVRLLPPKQRRLIIYKYIYNYSDVEIAEFLNISRQAVNRLKNRAIENLKAYYTEDF